MKASRLAIFTLLVLLSACAQTQTQPQRAAQGMDSDALASTNNRARVHTELAAQYYARRQYNVALEELREAFQADNAYAPAYNMAGLLHAALLEDKEADENFRHALDLAPEYSEAHNNYGYFLCSLGHYPAALSQFEQAWKNPLYATPEKALANAGQCALRMGNLEEAERYSNRALVRAPNQPQALMTLAEIRFRQGNIAMARSLLAQADARGGLDAAGLWLGVRIERKAGNREAEAEYAAQLRRRFPESHETGWMLSGQFDRQGDRP
jgi:type IV pilus assembly protein PilF